VSGTGEPLAEDFDGLDGIPLPRWRFGLSGRAAAESAFLDAYRSGRLPHAWLLGGPEGVGKATFAYRAARFLLAHPDPGTPAARTARDLAVDEAHPAARLVGQLAHPDLFVLRRRLAQTGKPGRFTVIDDVRQALRRLAETPGQAGWRIVIVDPADDLNLQAANALLKALEEPPPRTVFLVVAHRPAQVLPTIRSRCRKLAFPALGASEMDQVLAELAPDTEPGDRRQAAARAAGSPRRALELLAGSGLATVRSTEALLERLPEVDVGALHAFADGLARAGADADLALFRDTLEAWIQDRVRAGVAAKESGRRLSRLAEAAAELRRRQATADAYNLDRRQDVIGSLLVVAEALGRRSAAA
jgi:DNA polymerase-3 subunit delta'